MEILCRKTKLSADIDIDKIVLNTPGYVGADLNALIDEALISSLDRLLIEKMNSEKKEETYKSDFVVSCKCSDSSLFSTKRNCEKYLIFFFF